MSVAYYGDFAEDDTVNIPFNTFSSDDPAASVTITNLVDADLKVHKDGNVTSIVTDGVTVAIDFGTTGSHMVTIDTSVDAAYSTGSEYAVRMEGTTVDGGTVGAFIGTFSIERAGGVLALLKGTNSLANIEDKIDIIDTNVDDIETDLGNATDGLGALKTLIDTVNTDLANGTDGLGALKTLIDTVNTDLSNGTDGLGALKTLIDALNDIAAADIWAVDATGQQTLGTFGQAIGDPVSNAKTLYAALVTDASGASVTADVATVNTDLGNATDGLGALKTLIDTVNTDLANGTDGLGALKTLIDALNDLSAANILTEVNTALDASISELGVAAPTATPSVRTALMLLYMAVRNKRDTTSTTDEIHDDAGTIITSASLTEDGTTFSKAEYT